MAGEISQAMRDRVRARLGDKGATNTSWSDAALFRFLNHGFQVLVAKKLPDAAVPYLTDVDEVTLIDGRKSYALPTDFLRARRLEYKGLPAKRWPIHDLRALRRNVNYNPSETDPYFYIWNNNVYFENPVTQAGAEVYHLWYVRRPVAISATVDPELPRPFFEPVETFAVSRALEAISGPDEPGQAAMAEAKRQMALFDELCYVMASRFRPGRPYDGTPNDPDLKALREAIGS